METTWFETFFDQSFYEKYYQFCTPEQNRQEVKFLIKFLKIKKEHAVLDLPCGFGRHSLIFKELGYNITGADYSIYQLDNARELMKATGIEFPAAKADMRNLPWENRFDFLLNLFTSFGYFDEEDNEKSAAEFFKVLKPGGKLAVDLFNPLYALMHYQERDFSHLADGSFLLEERRYDPVRGYNYSTQIHIKNGRKNEQSFRLRFYHLPELIRLFERAGFEYQSATYSYSEEPVSFPPKASRLMVLFRKPKK